MAIVGAAYAATLATPSERPILTISGKIAVTNKEDTAQFDRAMLESLGLVTVETTTPWHEGKV
ncbi:MAG TPA: oxidoreductase, partial [Microvirga sp.]|nr:oxidoreductase [Microvirga sp.]